MLTAVECSTSSPRAVCRESALVRPAAYVGLVLCIIAFWMIQHPYERIVHDSILYAFSALARLHPRSLGHDIYLTVGIQDRYTVFSPLVAPLIHTFGLERAASLVTLVAQISFFFCGWMLARKLMPHSHAILAVALLVMLPPIYGDRHIFSYAEGFMTPRLPSEVFVLCTLIAVIGRRYTIASACLLLATVLHPIMAAAGFVMVFILLLWPSRPRVLIAIPAAGFAALIGIAFLAPIGPVSRFDAGWFQYLYSHGSYLFPTRWGLDDWAHASIPLSVLTAGYLGTTERRVHAICGAALLTGLAGLAISLVGSDLLHIVIVAQVQPWRWLWLSNCLAVIVTPVVLGGLWRGKGALPSAAILLAAAWVCIDEPYAPILGLSAILVATIGHRFTDQRRAKLLLAGSSAVLLAGLLLLAEFILRVVKDLALIQPDRILYSSPYLLWLRHLKPWQAGGIAPACIFLAAWWVATHRKDLASAIGIVALGLVLCAGFAQFSWNSWVNWPRAQFSATLVRDFAPWRRAIPARAQVLWGDSAVPVWFLLHRASYWSREQTAASVFSEPMARMLARREWAIVAVAKSTRDPHKVMVRTCRANPALGFYATTAGAGPTPYPAVKTPSGAGIFRLYRCADYRE